VDPVHKNRYSIYWISMPSAVTLLLMYICHLGYGIHCYWNLVTIFTYQLLHSWHVLWGKKIAIAYTQVGDKRLGYGNLG